MPEGNGAQPEKPKPVRPGGAKLPPRGVMSWFFFLMLGLLLVFFVSKTMQASQQISLTRFTTLVDNGDIKEITIRPDRILGEMRVTEGLSESEKANPRFWLYYPKAAVEYPFLKDLQAKLPGVKIEYEQESVWVAALVGILPWLFMIALIWFFIFRQIRAAGGGAGMLGNFGRSRHRVSNKEHTNITFADVAGIQEAKEEVAEIIEFLRCPKKFQRLGARIPRGVLLVGVPGCGKTLLAKAIAGEADVPFFSISGSDFVEMFVGVGASRVRDLFRQAKENSPCIVFLDEIDAVGRKRGTSFGGGGHDEREQTLNAILVEMDGFDSSDQVIVIAATNRVDVLDPALIRPGRFDRQVHVSLPDVQGRYEILKVHARKVKLGPNVDLRRLARGTPMFSGADMAAIINEAALIATMANKEFVEQDDLEESRDKVRWGRARKSRVVDQQEQTIVAYHEAGHALVQALEKNADPLHKVTILPRGDAGGVTFSLPERDRIVYGREYLLAMMKVTLGGRVAEEIYCGDISSGASSDIRKATEIARRMVKDWGMNEHLGFVYYGDEEDERGFLDMGGRSYSEKTAEQIDAEVKAIIDLAHQETRQVITDYKDKGEAIARALLKYETLSGDEVNALIRGETLDRPVVPEVSDEDKRRERQIGVARPVSNDKQSRPELGGGPLAQPG